ncbi:MAG: hypothetical protein M3Y64_04730 [Gemmatimonadota bacterium]|nr:hypothetical protein [Gemmatimonadota bacterium]
MFRRTSLAISTLIAHSLLAASLRAQAPVEKVHLVFVGGPNAGTYEAVGTRAGCSANATGPGSFGNQLSDPKGAPNKFNSLQLIVPDAKKAATGTSEFQVIFGFGPLMHRTKEYTVNTLPETKKKVGSGTVKVTQSGASATIDIAAVTADGVKINGTINCLTVTRM